MTKHPPGEKRDDAKGVERLLPQLMMVRHGMANLPPMETPPPYALRTFREDDVAAWEEIVAESFDKQPGTYRFDALVRKREPFSPERVFFIVCPDDKPVATATGLLKPNEGHMLATLHMVGVLHSHTGKKLGYWVSLAALHQLAREGAEGVSLLSDDFRIPAIKTYLRLGFEPSLVHENQRERWRNIFATLGDKEDWLARFASILEGPVHESETSSG